MGKRQGWPPLPLQWSHERRTVRKDPMIRNLADMRRKGQEPFEPEPHAVFSLIQAAATRLNVGSPSRFCSGQSPVQCSIQYPDRSLFSNRLVDRGRGSRDVWEVTRHNLSHGSEASDPEFHVRRVSLL